MNTLAKTYTGTSMIDFMEADRQEHPTHNPLMRDGIWAVMGWKDLQKNKVEREPSLFWVAMIVMLSFIVPVLAWSETPTTPFTSTTQLASAKAELLPPPVFNTPIARPASRADVAPKVQGVEVPVLITTVRRGHIISAADITTKTVRNPLSPQVVRHADDLIGMEVFRNIRANAPVYGKSVRIPPVVSKNRLIPIYFNAAGIQIKGIGKALEDGTTGSSIRVLNEESGQTLAGIVKPNGTVEIQ